MPVTIMFSWSKKKKKTFQNQINEDMFSFVFMLTEMKHRPMKKNVLDVLGKKSAEEDLLPKIDKYIDRPHSLKTPHFPDLS